MDKKHIILYIIMAASSFNILSYNTGGLSQIKRVLLNDIMSDTEADIVLLQETWLHKRDLNSVCSLHHDYIGVAKSSIPDHDILVGRPYGGLAILWNKALDINIKHINIDCDRIDGILLSLNGGNTTLILNVYLPVDNRNIRHVSIEYEACLDAIEIILNEYECDFVVIGGDFNTDFIRNNAQSHCLVDLMERSNLVNAWSVCSTGGDDARSIVTFTTSEGHTSCIDHFLVDSISASAVTNVSVLDYLPGSTDAGHFPIILSTSFDSDTSQA